MTDEIIDQYLRFRGISREQYELEEILRLEPECTNPQELLFQRKLAIVQHNRDADSWCSLSKVFLPAIEIYNIVMDYKVQNSGLFEMRLDDLDGLWRIGVVIIANSNSPYIPTRSDVRKEEQYFRSHPMDLPGL